MKHTSKKTTQATAHAAGRESSAGPNGIAIAPPAYGIDAADRQGGQAIERASGISLSENAIVKQLTHGQVDLHRSGARVETVSAADPRLQAIGARSYAQGAFALIGDPRDRGHELWHLAQQAQDRVRAETEINGQPVNLDHRLEREADVKGNLINRSAPAYLNVSSHTPSSLRSAEAVGQLSRGCGCGGQCGCCGSESERRSIRSPKPDSKLAIQPMLATGRRNPPRSATPTGLKKMTKRQQDRAFGSGTSANVAKKRKVAPCPLGTGPRAANWQTTMWNGSSRPGWNAAALALLPANCVLCGNPATDRDHIVPYRIHISNNAALHVFCDGTCHFLGISTADASLWSNDLTNLRPLCGNCNGVKSAVDKADPQNVNQPPTLLGPCPNAPNGCPACGSICL